MMESPEFGRLYTKYSLSGGINQHQFNWHGKFVSKLVLGKRNFFLDYLSKVRLWLASRESTNYCHNY